MKRHLPSPVSYFIISFVALFFAACSPFVITETQRQGPVQSSKVTPLPWPGPDRSTPAQIDAGILHCTEILNAQPRNADAYRCRGMLRQAKKDIVGALPDLKKAVELAPFDANAYIALTMAYMDKGNYREAHVTALSLAKLGSVKPIFVGAFLNESAHKMSIEDELDLKKKNMLARYRSAPTVWLAISQWETIERLHTLVRDKRLDEIPLCWSKGKYRDYVQKRLRDDPDSFLREFTKSQEQLSRDKGRFLNGQLIISFVKEDGEWKIDEL